MKQYIVQDEDVKVEYNASTSIYTLYAQILGVWTYIHEETFPGCVNRWLEDRGYKRVGRNGDVPQGYYRKGD